MSLFDRPRGLLEYVHKLLLEYVHKLWFRGKSWLKGSGHPGLKAARRCRWYAGAGVVVMLIAILFLLFFLDTRFFGGRSKYEAVAALAAIAGLCITVTVASFLKASDEQSKTESTRALFRTDIVALLQLMCEYFSRYPVFVLASFDPAQAPFLGRPGPQDYFGIFDRNAGNLSCLDARAEECITQFYRYGRAGREAIELSASRWSALNPYASGMWGATDWFRYDLLYLIELLDKTLESGARALNEIDELGGTEFLDILEKFKDRQKFKDRHRGVTDADLDDRHRGVTQADLDNAKTVKEDIALAKERLQHVNEVVKNALLACRYYEKALGIVAFPLYQLALDLYVKPAGLVLGGLLDAKHPPERVRSHVIEGDTEPGSALQRFMTKSAAEQPAAARPLRPRLSSKHSDGPVVPGRAMSCPILRGWREPGSDANSGRVGETREKKAERELGLNLGGRNNIEWSGAPGAIKPHSALRGRLAGGSAAGRIA